MIYRTSSVRLGGIGAAAGMPPPRDLIVILATLFVTFSLQFFAKTAVIPALLRLTPGVLRGYLWQVATYPFVGFGGSGLWFLVELFILYMFARDVFWRLGRTAFWRTLVRAAFGAGLVAVAIVWLQRLIAAESVGVGTFQLMQGQRMLIAIMIASFATLWGEATILLFFVLPVKARWFLWLEIVFAFIGFLPTKDLAGFCGICTAVFLAYSGLVPGGPRRVFHNWRKRGERFIIEQRLERMKRKRRFDVIDGDGGSGDDQDRWVH